MNVQVVNVFTHSDYAPFTELDSPERISELRRSEDEALQDLIGHCLSFIDLGLWDAPLRLQIPLKQVLLDPLDSSSFLSEVRDVEIALKAALAGADFVLLPMAIGNHIDHLIARDATMKCVPPENLVFYEDLPYAASIDERQMTKVLKDFEPMAHLHPTTVRRPNGAALKRLFASCYRSQIDASAVAAMATYAENHDGGETFYARDTALLFSQISGGGKEGPSEP